MVNAQQFKKGVGSYLAATPFMFKNRMAWWYLVPLLVYLLIFVSLLVYLHNLLGPLLEDWLASTLGIESLGKENWWQSFKFFAVKGLVILAGLVLKIIVFIAVQKVVKYAILIVLSPVLAYVSELSENRITGVDYPFNGSQFAKDIVRGILFSLRSLFMELLIMAAVGMVSLLFPILSPLTVSFLFIVSCYYMGVSMMDYVAERKKLNVKQSLQYMKENRWVAIGIGFMFNITFFLPILKFVLAPINGAVGSVLAEYEPSQKATIDR